jgi:hypothetical protein
MYPPIQEEITRISLLILHPSFMHLNKPPVTFLLPNISLKKPKGPASLLNLLTMFLKTPKETSFTKHQLCHLNLFL